MNPNQETDAERIGRFQDAVLGTFKCSTTFIARKECDLMPHPKGDAYTFGLKGPVREYPEAKKCYVWDAREFKPSAANEIVIVFDVQVLSDPEQLPFDAVSAWLSDSLVKDRDIYAKSEKWTKDELHKMSVWFNLPDGTESGGHFFVRESADGKIAVRIFQEGNKEVAGRNWLINNSLFPLTAAQIEAIQKPDTRAAYFTVRL
jgi:hypothetical protein